MKIYLSYKVIFFSFFEWAGLAGWLPRHRRVISLELRSLLMLTFPAVVFLTAGAPVKGLCHWNPGVSHGSVAASLRGPGFISGEMDVE